MYIWITQIYIIMNLRYTINSITLFLLSFSLMTIWVHFGSETEWLTAMCVAAGSSLVAILVPVRRYRIRR